LVIRVYIDESIGKNRTFALGCVIANDSMWKRINHDWKRCLQRKNRQLTRQGRRRVSRYHASDCESRFGEFKDWDVSEKNAFVAELISIVNRHHIHIVGFTVYLEELAEFYPQIEKEYAEKAAYGALATLLFPEIVEQASQISRQPAIKIVYEHGEVAQHMQYAYDSMKSNKPFGELFDSIEKNNWKVIPLQGEISPITLTDPIKIVNAPCVGCRKQPAESMGSPILSPGGPKGPFLSRRK